MNEISQYSSPNYSHKIILSKIFMIFVILNLILNKKPYLVNFLSKTKKNYL